MRPELHKAKNNARRCVIPVDGIRTLRNKSEAPSRTCVTPPLQPFPRTAFRAFWQWQKGGRLEAKYLERWIYSVPRLDPGSTLLKNANESPFVLDLREGKSVPFINCDESPTAKIWSLLLVERSNFAWRTKTYAECPGHAFTIVQTTFETDKC